MAEAVKNSIFISILLRFGKALYRWWQHSLLCRFGQLWGMWYSTSRTRRIWRAFIEVADYSRHSLYARLMAFFRRMLRSVGIALQASCCYRLLMRLKALWLKLGQRSAVCGLISSLSPRQWLLFAFGMYLPLEYIIRDVLSIGILSSLWEELFILIAAAMVVWNLMLDKDDIRRETPLDMFIILFMAVGLLLASIVCPVKYIAIAGYRAQVEYMVWFFLIIRLLRDEKDFRVLYASLFAALVFLTFHGIWQFVIGVEIPDAWVTDAEVGVRTRVYSLTGSPNILGSLLVLLAPLSAGLIYYCRRPAAKAAAFGFTCLIFGCLLFTFSRGAWVGMIVTVTVFALYLDKRLLALMGSAMAAVLLAVPSITSRITFLFTEEYRAASALGGRAMRWATGRQLLAESDPLLGFGLGRFGGAVAMQNQVLDVTETFRYFYMDNYYLKTLVEMGWLGLGFFLLMMVMLVIWGMRAIDRSDVGFGSGDALLRGIGNYRVLAVSLWSGLCGVLVHCYFENIFEEPYMMAYFWGVAAMLLYLGFFRRGGCINNKKEQQL
ncbi:MAG: O-antigen ligase family protein [Firmicutes bacterium]|nr:O-antigen ligase family protein [Bacillota bacterium]